VGANTSILDSFRVCDVGDARVFDVCTRLKKADLSFNFF
jgi:hypothetical protein